ncbi:MAG TPA: translocation/assembly module TamB domain-containing protein [Gemmatimonadales bacterium]
MDAALLDRSGVLMRGARRVVVTIITAVLLLIPAALGTFGALVLTAPGHALLARIASRWITGAVAGAVEIGALRGNLWDHLELDSLVVRDERGAVVLSTPRLEVSYVLPELLAHRLVFRNVRTDSLILHLVRLRAGRWNYEEVFHLGEGPGNGQPPPTVAIDGLDVTHGTLQVDVPTTPGRPRQPASRNARVPDQPRIDTTADGPVRVYAATQLDTRIRLLRISTPRHDPLLVRITALRANLNDPRIAITQFAGQILAAGDTLRFTIDSAGMPSSRLSGGGAVRWPHDTVLYDFALDAPRVALRDLRWIQPDFPDWEGHGHVIARSINGSRNDFVLDHLALGDSSASIAGHMTVITDNSRGLGMHGLDLQLTRAPIDLLRPYLDTLPVSGSLTGHLVAEGFLDGLHLNGDLVFADRMVAGAPASHLVIDGLVHFGGPQGAVFEQFQLNRSAVALGTIDRLIPSLAITGSLGLNGTLDGAWQNAQFVGTVEHTAPSGALSRMAGRVRLDTRGPVLGVVLDADFDPLSFDALRSGYPELTSRGTLTGHVTADGNLDELNIDATLDGEIGSVHAQGRITVDAPHFGADSLVVDMERLDAGALLGTDLSTALNGRVTAQGNIDTGASPSGTVDLALDRSRFGGATVDALTGVVHADRGLLTIDTGTVIWSAGRVDARGTIGWSAPDSGTLTVAAAATSLAPFDSLVRAATGVASDTVHPHVFDGQATASLQLAGAIDNASVTGTVHASNVVLDAWHAALLNATLRADSMGSRGIAISAVIDTVGNDAHVADQLRASVSGRGDSLRIAGGLDMVALKVGGGGIWQHEASGTRIRLDSLSMGFPHQRWDLAHPAEIVVTQGQVTLRDTVRLESADGSGEVRVSGVVPGDQPGKLDASANGLSLLDIFGVVERDTTALDGLASFDLHLAGTRDAPTFNGDASVVGAVLGDAQFPAATATFTYGGQRLHSDVALWRAGQRILDGTVTLPLDLALAGRTTRRVGGDLDIRGTADSVDLVVLAALIPTIRDPTGQLSFHLNGSGTWDAPRLTGTFAIHDGALGVPSLRVRYGPINGRARFVADSLVIDTLQVRNGDGELDVTGGVRLEQLTRPTLDLKIHAQSFLAMDVPGDMTLRGTGNMRLTGPLLQPTLTGDQVILSRSVVYFTDILTKTIVDLEDPENAALIDTTALRRQGLGNQFSIRFLDSLNINALPVRIGNDVWLRSNEANIQLEGNLTVDKDRKVYGLTGLLNAPRGTYTLQVGPIYRDFSVDQGTIQYYGTPDLNPDISIKAHHQVRTIDGDDFNVVATITGTIREPKVSLDAPGRNLTDRDLVSYVLFGRSEFQLTGAQQGNQLGSLSTSVSLALGALSNQLQHTLINSGVPVSTFTFRPGITPGAVVSGSSVTQLAAGWQFGPRWFVTFDAGVCFGSSANFRQRNFGASIEYRITRQVRFQAAAEPVQTCITNRAADVFTRLDRYQLGGDFLWQRDY